MFGVLPILRRWRLYLHVRMHQAELDAAGRAFTHTLPFDRQTIVIGRPYNYWGVAKVTGAQKSTKSTAREPPEIKP